jgi:hypothetical protein
MSAATDEACRLAQNLARNSEYAVFPCREDKRPACLHGFHDASRDPDVIAELWRRYPGPLVAIATGPASAIAVVDCDRKHPEAVIWWQRNHHRLLPTRAYATRSGGLHVYFRDRPGIGNTQGKLCCGVDTRGSGGYIISWFAAGFDCLDHSPPAPLPDWLHTAITYQPPVPPVAPRSRNPDRALDGVLHKLAEAREGERNGVLFWCACRLAEHGVGHAEAEAQLIPIATSIGLSPHEARQTIRSAMRRAAQ